MKRESLPIAPFPYQLGLNIIVMFGPTPPHLLGVPGVGGGGPGGHLAHHPFSPFGGGGGFDQTKVNRSKRKKMSAVIDI